MRRKEKEITSLKEIEAVLAASRICRLAMVDGGEPYLVPMNFGYREGALYFHTAREGRKIDVLRKNSRVCFEVEADVTIVESEEACDWGTRYRSVIGTGSASFVEDESEKRECMDIIMRHHSGKGGWYFREASARKACIIKVVIDTMAGKKSG
jgi:nitroimidazol reductase NimA-like FMN-containing flavoprotein (pyridoxamine 5'-phosphate oxidase superfamily)